MRDLNFLLDGMQGCGIHGIGVAVGAHRGVAGVATRTGTGVEIDSAEAAGNHGRAIPHHLQFSGSIPFVHWSKFVATTSHSVVPNG